MKMQLSQAVISAGGFGTRLRPLCGDIPKPLFPFCGLLIIEHAVKEISSQGILSFIFLLHHKAHEFIAIIPSLEKKYNITIKYFVEPNPRGEAAALWLIKDILDDNFLFLGADILFRMSIRRLTQYFLDTQADFLLVTHRTTHPEDSDLVQETYGGRITSYKLKDCPSLEGNPMFLGNSGIYVLKKNALLRLPEPSAEARPNLFSHLISFVNEYNIFSYNTTEYIHDIGTPSRYLSAERDWNSGIVHSRSYQEKQSALFIDRDNTLIHCPPKSYISQIHDLVIIDANLELVKNASSEFSIVWIVSNQPQISMGRATFDDVYSFNSYLINSLIMHGINIDGFSICPHHPHQGFENEIPILKSSCFCRKPRTGMFLEQQSLRNIDLTNSLIIGDSYADEEVSRRLGCSFVSVQK